MFAKMLDFRFKGKFKYEGYEEFYEKVPGHITNIIKWGEAGLIVVCAGEEKSAKLEAMREEIEKYFVKVDRD